MEPITLLVNALIAGAAAALKPTAEQAVKDAYQGLKSYIKLKWAKLGSGVDFLESDPTSSATQAAVKEGLKKAVETDGADEKVLKAAQQVLSVVAANGEAAKAAQAAGVTIEDLKAGASIDIGRVLAEAGAVNVRRLTADQDIRIGEVIAGNPRRQ